MKAAAQETVAVLTGEGPFEAVSDNQQGVSVEVNDKTLTINALKEGQKATITVTDTKTKKTAQVKVTVEFNEFVVTKGKEKTLPITSNYEVTSDDTTKAEVKPEGNGIKLIGVSVGETTLTLKDKNTQEIQKVAVKVVDVLDLLRKTFTVTEGGESLTAILRGMPEPKYSVSKDESIAVFERIKEPTADDPARYVVIRGIKAGTTDIDISDGDNKVTLKITVRTAPAFSVNVKDINIAVEDVESIEIVGNGNFEITVENPQIASIDEPNNYDIGDTYFASITGIAAGTTKIIIKEKRNSEVTVKEINVTVTAKEED